MIAINLIKNKQRRKKYEEKTDEEFRRLEMENKEQTLKKTLKAFSRKTMGVCGIKRKRDNRRRTRE